MPSNPLRKILDRRKGEAGNFSEEALEKLEREIRESREAVRRQNRGIARGYFDGSIEALRHQVQESRATLEGLPEQVPGGDEESFRSFIEELAQSYARIEEALDEAAGNAPDADSEETEDSEETADSEEPGTDERETEETGPEDAAADDEVFDGARAAIEGVGETAEGVAEPVVGVAEQAVGGEGDRQEEPRASDAARRRAQDLGVDLSEVEGTGSGGAITVRDVNKLVEASGETVEDVSDQASEIVVDALDAVAPADEAAEEDGQEGGEEVEDEPRATNAARRRAEELGVDLAGIEGSGANGLITIQDVVKP